MTQEFDMIVVGSGTAAKGAAYQCREAGWDVAVIDRRPFGGTCVLRGCDPKKVLVGVAEAVDNFSRRLGNGTDAEQPGLDWPAAMEFKRSFTRGVPDSTEQALIDAGIHTFHGTASFEDERTLRVGDQQLRGEHILIASGAKPMPLPIDGAEHLTTSDEFLELDQLAQNIVFVGGGFISFEFAHIAAQAGARAQILEMQPQPLQQFDGDMVARLIEATEDHGIRVWTETKVEAIETTGEGYRVRIASPEGEQTLDADLVVHGAGRVPALDHLKLDRGNVEYGRRGVHVNEYLQSSSNPAVYAAGDCADTLGPPLTPVAGKEGRVAATNMLNGNQQTPDYTGTGSVIFTLPPLAAVGMNEQQAEEEGRDFEVKHGDSSSWYTSRQSLVRHAGFKVLVEKGSGRILGATVLGTHAEDIINLFGLAIKSGASAEMLQQISWGYPSPTSDIQYMV